MLQEDTKNQEQNFIHPGVNHSPKAVFVNSSGYLL